MPRVAAVQMTAVPMDIEGGLDAIRAFAADATAQGAELVVFPELVVPGYPRYIPDPFPWTDVGHELWSDIQRYFKAYAATACVVPGPLCTGRRSPGRGAGRPVRPARAG